MAKMVDIGTKPDVHRRAVATGSARPDPWIRVGMLFAYPMAVDTLRVALTTQPDLRVVLATTDIDVFRERLPSVAPDVALVDLRMGLHLVTELLGDEQIVSGETGVIVVANTRSTISRVRTSPGAPCAAARPRSSSSTRSANRAARLTW